MISPIDIVLPVHGQKSYTEVCLATLEQHTKSYRLLVVDDCSDEETTQFLQGYLKGKPSAVYLRTFKQRWFTRAVNLGLRMVRTPYVVVLNSDCVMDEGWLEELYGVKAEVEAMGERAGLVGAVFSAEELRRWAFARPSPPDYVTGHCWLLDMHAITLVSVNRGTPGWYMDETDQRNIHIYSDNELSHRLTAAGYACVKSFKARVGHHGGKSWDYDLGRVFGLTLQQVNDTY